MTDKPKHEIITDNIPQSEEMISIPVDVLINTLSYHETLGSEGKTRQKNLLTSGHTYLADVISCLDVIKDGATRKVTITVTLDKYFEPKLITKRYLVDHRDYSGRTSIK